MQCNKTIRLTVLATALLAMSGAALADTKAAAKWVDAEFKPSTLTRPQQMTEMQWFIDAAAKLKAKGVTEIHVVSESLDTHIYESKTLAPAFTEITGIKVIHDVIQEGDVVEKMQTSMQSGRSIYDGWVGDSDLIGTHYRYGQAVVLTERLI
jgi:glycerol transport system substrate-binding protein